MNATPATRELIDFHLDGSKAAPLQDAVHARVAGWDDQRIVADAKKVGT